jgi:hypothetical protein
VLGTFGRSNCLLRHAKILVVFKEEDVEVAIPSLQLTEQLLYSMHSV